MDQSSGSSVQTQIFPPENIKNIRLYTKYAERNIVKMMLNCFVLDTGVHFSIPLGEKVSVGEYEYSIESLSISILKDYIWECRNNVLKDLTNDVSKLDLWHVNVEEVVNVSNEDDIQKLRGDKMKPNLPLSNYFSVSDPPPKWNIHIIIHRPPTTDQRLTDISRVIGELGYFPRQNGRGGTMLFKLEQDAYTVEGISLTDPDINKRPELVSFLVKRLEQRRVILFRAPPYSGKTSLAQLLENYLVVNNSSEKLRVIRVSLLWGSSVGVKCEYDTFCEVWKKIVGVEWYEWAGQCEKIPTVLIMDETQRIYESMEEADESTEEADESMEEADKSTEEADESMENTGTADEFWDTIKACLQGTNLSVIMFAAYGYGAKSAGLSTPLHIQPENCMSLRDIRFTDKKLEEYIGDYCVRNFGLSIYDYIVLQFIRYINHATAGHVGFVRHILERTKDEMQSKIRNEKLNWKEIYRYLNSSRFNQTINSCRAAPKLYKFSKAQKKICEDVYLNGSVLFSDNDDNHKDLIKTGILIVDNTNCLCFSAPLIERSFFQQHYGSETRASSTPGSLYEFIVKTFTIICNESDKVLKDSLGTGKNKRLLEQTWQKEFYKAGTRALGSHHFLSCDVGPHFKSKGYIDFYVDELEWAIELLREGLGMEEHNRRFETTGEYKEIVEVAKEKAIIDVRSKTKKVLELKEEFVHVSYSDNYDSFMIECLGKETIEIIKS